MISLLVPTRKRLKEFKRFYESAMNMADDPYNIEVVAYVDEDDHTYDGLNLMNLKIVRGKRVVLSEMWNECWKVATGPYYGHMGDDIRFETPNWDVAVREAIDSFPGKIGFVWGDDKAPTGRQKIFGTHGFVHKNWTDVTGRFVPPYFSSDYNDTWFNDISELIESRKFLPTVHTNHLHYVWGKALKDQTTLDRLERHQKDDPESLYYSPQMQWEREQEAFELRKAIERAQGTKVKLSILVCTLLERGEQFTNLINTLNKQIKKYNGEIEIIAYWNNGERYLADIRQALVDEARGEYVCFIDDDDRVPDYYCDKIMEAIKENPDMVGWRMQAYENGKKLKPTFHSLKYKTWTDDKNGYYRNASHLNPVKKEIAERVKFRHRGKYPEDQRWAKEIGRHLTTEVFIEDVMYHYHYEPASSRWQSNQELWRNGARPDIRIREFRYHPECPMLFEFKPEYQPLGYAGPGPAP